MQSIALPATLITLDTEFDRDVVVQIGATVVGTPNTFCHVIHKNTRVNKELQIKTGITDSDIAAADTAAVVFRNFLTWLDLHGGMAPVIVAHNASADARMIVKTMDGAGVPAAVSNRIKGLRLACSMEYFRAQKEPKLGLDALYMKRFGSIIPGRHAYHDALHDAVALADILKTVDCQAWLQASATPLSGRGRLQKKPSRVVRSKFTDVRAVTEELCLVQAQIDGKIRERDVCEKKLEEDDAENRRLQAAEEAKLLDDPKYVEAVRAYTEAGRVLMEFRNKMEMPSSTGRCMELEKLTVEIGDLEAESRRLSSRLKDFEIEGTEHGGYRVERRVRDTAYLKMGQLRKELDPEVFKALVEKFNKSSIVVTPIV